MGRGDGALGRKWPREQEQGSACSWPSGWPTWDPSKDPVIIWHFLLLHSLCQTCCKTLSQRLEGDPAQPSFQMGTLRLRDRAALIMGTGWTSLWADSHLRRPSVYIPLPSVSGLRPSEALPLPWSLVLCAMISSWALAVSCFRSTRHMVGKHMAALDNLGHVSLTRKV